MEFLQNEINSLKNENLNLQSKIDNINNIQTSDPDLQLIYDNHKSDLQDKINQNTNLINSLQSNYNNYLQTQSVTFNNSQQQFINMLNNTQINNLKSKSDDERIKYFNLIQKCNCHNEMCILNDILLG